MADSSLADRLTNFWEPPKLLEFFNKTIVKSPQLLKKGKLLFCQGDNLEKLYFIQDGFMKLYRTSEEGKETSTHLLGPGALLGVRVLVSQNEQSRHTAETLTDVKIIPITRQEYFQVSLAHPEMLVDLLHVFIDRLTYTELRLEGIMYTSATARVAYFLAEAATKFGQQQRGNQITIPLQLTHQRIAEFVGCFRETVTIALHKLEEEKAIMLERGKVTITNLQLLEQIAMVESTA